MKKKSIIFKGSIFNAVKKDHLENVKLNFFSIDDYDT